MAGFLSQSPLSLAASAGSAASASGRMNVSMGAPPIDQLTMPSGTFVAGWTRWANHQPTALKAGDTLGPSVPHSPLKNLPGRRSASCSGLSAALPYWPGKAWARRRTCRLGDLSILAASGAAASSRSGHSMLDWPAQIQTSPTSTSRARASPEGAEATISRAADEAGRARSRASHLPSAPAVALALSLARRTLTVSPGVAVPRITTGWSRCSTISSPIIGSKATAAFRTAVSRAGSARKTMRVA